jgi:hypothetical protein
MTSVRDPDGPSASADEQSRAHFFVAHAPRDQGWAEWIAWELEQFGYAVILQGRFRPGNDEVHELQAAFGRADRVLAVWSSAYADDAPLLRTLTNAALQADPTGSERKIIFVRIEDRELPGWISTRIPIDLLGSSETDARDRLLQGVGEDVGPQDSKPRFPGVSPPVTATGPTEPAFPGAATAAGKAPADGPAPSLSGSSLRLVAAHSSTRPADPERLLSGASLTAAEIDAGLAVDRILEVQGRHLSLAEVPAALVELRGLTLLLTASAGEGKSTYLQMLRRALPEAWTVLRWDPPDLDIETLRDLATESEGGDPAGPRLVVLCEVFNLDEHTAMQMSRSLNRREDGTDHAVFLIAGRPRDIGLLRQGIAGSPVPVRLAPMDEAASLTLTKALVRAAEMAALSDEEIRDRYPNLDRFLDLSVDDQLQALTAGDRPLIAGLLEAVYGEHLWGRVANEYQQLARPDAQAYLHVALAHYAGSPMETSTLMRLAGAEADLVARSARDPWIFDEAAQVHVARHEVIAHVLLEGMADGPALLLALTQWMDSARVSAKVYRFAERGLYGLLTPRDPIKSGSSLNERLRVAIHEVLTSADGLESTILLNSGSNTTSLTTWVNVLVRAVGRGRGPDAVHLLKIADTIMSRLLDRPLEQQSPRWDYYQTKIRVRIYEAGEEQPHDPRPDVLSRWASYQDYSQFGADFYADCFNLADDLIEEEVLAGSAERQPTVEYFRVLMWSYVWLNALDEKPELRKARTTRHTRMVARYLYLLPGETVITLLREEWLESKRARAPLYRTAFHLAKLLMSGGESEQVAEAYELLFDLVSFQGPWNGEAALLLADRQRHADWPGPLPDLSLFRRNLARAKGGALNRAFLAHALGLLVPEEEAAEHLASAADAYAEGLQSEDDLNEWESRWRNALRTLRKLDREAADSRQDAYLNRRRRLGRAAKGIRHGRRSPTTGAAGRRHHP